MNISYEQVRRALDELVRDGHLVAVEELDPSSGRIRYRYFLRDLAPKPN